MVDILRQYAWDYLIDPSHCNKITDYKMTHNLTSHLHNLWAEVVYCQWPYIRLQILTMTQPSGSHHPLHKFRLIQGDMQLLTI